MFYARCVLNAETKRIHVLNSFAVIAGPRPLLDPTPTCARLIPRDRHWSREATLTENSLDAKMAFLAAIRFGHLHGSSRGRPPEARAYSPLCLRGCSGRRRYPLNPFNRVPGFDQRSLPYDFDAKLMVYRPGGLAGGTLDAEDRTSLFSVQLIPL
ncbi:hypothetical protein TgHK011_008163 [Trichoderma gracile]|nr:hypothetical protein TgHK011_008163 [Trichoderma gracile]